MTQEEWDAYYLGIAKVVSENTKCKSRPIGAIIVKDKSIISTGYNGPPAGMRPCDQRWVEDGLYDSLTSINPQEAVDRCPRRVLGFPSGKGLEFCVAAHAERNALLQAAKLGISTQGATLYCFCGVPCKDCMIEIVNAGIEEVVCLHTETTYDDIAQGIADECGVRVRKVLLPEG